MHHSLTRQGLISFFCRLFHKGRLNATRIIVAPDPIGALLSRYSPNEAAYLIIGSPLSTCRSATLYQSQEATTWKAGNVPRITSIFDEFDHAFSRRTLDLFRSEHARFYLALFKVVFPDVSEALPSGEARTRIDRCIAEMEADGYSDRMPVEDGKPKTSRAICRDMIDRYRWLESTVLPSGESELRLTADAREALAIADRLNSAETVMSGSRMRTIKDAIERASVLLSPDYEAGRAVLEARVEEATQDLERYIANGGSESITLEAAKREVVNIVDLMHEIPNDLAVLEKDVHAQGIELRDEFNAEVKPVGQIVGDYVRASEQLIESSENGRSFSDSLKVMGTPEERHAIRDQLESIADAPVFAGVQWEQRRRLNDSWSQILVGIGRVTSEEGRSTRIVQRYVTTHDTQDERALAKALKDLEVACARWAADSTWTDKVMFEQPPEECEVKSFPMKLVDVAEPLAPRAVVRHEMGDFTAEDLDALVALGGPQTQRIVNAIFKSPVLDDGKVVFAESFNALGAEQRRTSELSGLFQAVAELGFVLSPRRTSWICHASDGDEVVWRGPDIVMNENQFNRYRDHVNS